jgi:glutathione S-transferase
MDTCEHKSAKYLKINPNGKVPALAIDGRGAMFETKEVERLGRIGEVEHPLGMERPDGISIAGASPDWAVTVGGAAHANPARLDEIKDKAMEQIGEAWDRIERALAGGGPDMLGDRFSAADLPVVMLSGWREAQPQILEKNPHVRRLVELVSIRPAIARVLQQNQAAA